MKGRLALAILLVRVSTLRTTVSARLELPQQLVTGDSSLHSGSAKTNRTSSFDTPQASPTPKN